MKHSKEISVAIGSDDECLCRALARMLRETGMKPTAYASVETFLENAQCLPFDCVLLDGQPDGTSGIGLHRQFTSSNLLLFPAA